MRWYGPNRSVSEMTEPQVGSYAAQIASSSSGSEPTKKLDPVRALLAFAKKQGFTKINLSVHLRVRNQTVKKKAPGKRHQHREMALTAQGYAELKGELEALKKERPRVQEEIQRAAADKDVRENAPLEAAREKHGQMESRIWELEGIVTGAKVFRGEAQPALTASQGHVVTIQDLESGEIVSYTLVDPREVNPIQGKISIASPVGKAILGRSVGEVIEVATPGGLIHYRIEKIQP